MGILQEDIAGDVGSVPSCRTCGSTRVTKDAWAGWNSEAGLWELETVLDQEFCHHCEAATTFVWRRAETVPSQKVRELNDRFRTTGQGKGSVMITSGLQEKGGAFVVAAVNAVRTFDTFSEDNDPWGEHDFGAVEIEGEKVFWKIDCYDPTLTMGSENPANEAVTHRVLTIMLASEY